ncbi:MAG: nicotinamide riboside transporter PnuC [Candidatus Nanopelagicales bacterium]|nr:nicotinamide riboside transporter PnuC [Candidatus Nanopelagicales bacterium]
MFSEINEFVSTVLFTVLGYQVTLLELVAVIASATGVWLGTTGKRIMWPWYGISGVLYGWLFLNYDLYASASVQLVFIGAAIWGWFGWGPQGASSRNLTWTLRVTVITAGTLIWLLITPLLVSLGAAAARPDAFGLVFSVIAQVLMVLQFRENWLVWLVVNTVYVGLYWSQDLKFTSLLYVVFAAIALRGWVNWQKLQRTVR